MLLPRSSSWCLRLAVCLFCFTAPAVLSLPTSSRPSTITSPADVAADCYLRSFGVEFATWLQPPSPISNWTAAVEDGFEMNVLCAGQTYNTTDDNQARYPSPPLAKRPIALQRAEQLLSNCQHHVYVDANSGDDENAGSLSRPVQSIAVGLQLTRTIRINNTPLPQPNVAPPAICLVLRRATYYLSGTTSGIAGLTSAEISSRVGAIALTSVDSGLTVTAYPGEENEVILSGGTPLDQLPWTVYKKTPLGNILQATLPAGLDLNFRAANELYSDTGRLIRAKYPNSDPSTQGLWTEPTGWIAAAESWLPPRQYSPVVDVLVATPARNGTYFPNFHSGIGGRCTVFDPPAGYWCSDNPPAGGSFSSPSGLVDNSTLRSRMANWSRPEQGYVHVLHGAAWGSWVFAIDSIDTATATIHFGIGGTQEGRGAGAGSSYFVTNILEELDSPAEWFIDADNATIYFMPNQSMPHSMVLSQLSCLISVTGSMNDPAHDITIHGLTLTQTSNTYMRLHEMPSGGDFSVHRGAAVYATGTSGFTFTHNLLTQLGSNGITISDWNVNATINENEITFMGGSAIQIIGSAHDIDAVSNINQPHYTHVQSNLIHDLGIYIKQSAGVVQSVARASTLEGNVLFNAPRMQTCFNDGFAGGNVLAYNLGFNGMRETSDAGVFESWDRQPYLTTEGGMGPSLTPAWNHEHHNFAYVNYNTDAVINHDDGSSCQRHTTPLLPDTAYHVRCISDL